MSTDILEFPPLVAPAQAAVTVATIKEAALAPLVAAETQIRALAKRHEKVAFAVATKEGMAQAKAARNELREQGRFLVQRARDKFKADANDAKREVEAFCDRLIEVIKPVEDAVDGQIKAEEQRQAEEKARREREEEARKEKHRTAIAAIRIYAERASAPGMTAERIARGIAQLEALPTPTTEQWEEFAVPAANALCETLAKMRELHAKAVAEEAEAIRREQERQEQQRRAAELAEQERRLAAERAEIERQRAELEAARKVAEAQAARVVQVAAPAGYIEPQTVLTTTAKPITQDAQERGSLPAAAGACASAEAKAATAAVSGCEGKGAHAEERAPEPVFNIVSLERGAAAIDAASSGSPELGAVLESIATMELYKITMIEPIRGIDPRDALLREALALTKYAAAPFFSKFPTHPKTTPEWWAGLREQIEALQPKLIDHIQGLN